MHTIDACLPVLEGPRKSGNDVEQANDDNGEKLHGS